MTLKSRSAGRVLHVHYIVASDLTFEFIQAAVFYIVAQEKYFGRVVHAPVLLPHVDDVFHIRETFAFQVSALAGLQFRKHGIGHLHKVTVFFTIDDAEGMHVGVLAEIFQLRTVCSWYLPLRRRPLSWRKRIIESASRVRWLPRYFTRVFPAPRR